MRCNRVKRLLIFPYMTYMVLNIDLRSTIYGLRFTIYGMRFTLCDSRITTRGKAERSEANHGLRFKKNP